MAAVMAVVSFKKRYGFYGDAEGKFHSLYRIDANEIVQSYGSSSNENVESEQPEGRDEDDH